MVIMFRVRSLQFTKRPITPNPEYCCFVLSGMD